MKRTPTILTTLLTVTMAVLSHARDTPAPEKLVLGFREAILLALDNNLEIEVQRMAPMINQQRVIGEQSAFDPFINLRFLAEHSERPLNRQDFLATGQITDLINEENRRVEVSVGGRLPIGTSYEVVVRSNQLKNTLNVEPLSRFYPEYSSNAFVRVTQPLFRNFGVDSNLTALRLAESELRVEEKRLSAVINSVAGEVLFAYVDLIFAQERIQVNRESIRLARTLKEENQRRLEQGRMAPIDVIQAESAIASAETDLIQAESFLVERQNVLKNLLFEDFASHRHIGIEPESPLMRTLPPLRDHVLISQALERNPDYLGAIEQAESEDIRLKFARNYLYPQVDLELSLGFNGLAGTPHGSIGDFNDRDNPDWAVGLVFSMPIGNREPRARLRQARLRQHQALLSVKQIENEIVSSLDTALDRVNATSRQVESSLKGVEFANAALEAEERRLVNGLTTSFNVLRLQDDLARSRIQHLETLVQFNKSLIVLWALVGTLPDQFNILVRTDGLLDPRAG